MQEEYKLEAQGVMEDAEDKQHELGVQKESTQVESNDQVAATAEVPTVAEMPTMMINTCGDGPLVGLPRTESIIEAEEVVTAPPAEVEIRYSWYYYEREDQFEGLFDSLNLKG